MVDGSPPTSVLKKAKRAKKAPRSRPPLYIKRGARIVHSQMQRPLDPSSYLGARPIEWGANDGDASEVDEDDSNRSVSGLDAEEDAPRAYNAHQWDDASEVDEDDYTSSEDEEDTEDEDYETTAYHPFKTPPVYTHFDARTHAGGHRVQRVADALRQSPAHAVRASDARPSAYASRPFKYDRRTSSDEDDVDPAELRKKYARPNTATQEVPPLLDY